MAAEITGFLHIVRIDAAVDPVSAEYRVAFAPVGGRLRGRYARCQGLDRLTDLLRRAEIPIPEIERTWRTVTKRRFHAIPRVTLTSARLEELGL
ncbi:MAG TPA: hypothetical protein VJX92_03300 [Methylomirabilota bacterium]|nr:hypothetical protein [Methylomirabilota bacterium]